MMQHQQYKVFLLLIIWLTMSITTVHFINKYYGYQKDQLKQQ